MGELPEGTHRIITRLDRDETRIVSGHAKILAAALERDYMPRPPHHEPHHIVPATQCDSVGHCALARKILRDSDVDINQADNGVWLPRTSITSRTASIVQSDAATSHDNVHTRIYFAEIARRLSQAFNSGGPNMVIPELHSIRWRLVQGNFPH